jgi:hypothetical protein
VVDVIDKASESIVSKSPLVLSGVIFSELAVERILPTSVAAVEAAAADSSVGCCVRAERVDVQLDTDSALGSSICVRLYSPVTSWFLVACLNRSSESEREQSPPLKPAKQTHCGKHEKSFDKH